MIRYRVGVSPSYTITHGSPPLITKIIGQLLAVAEDRVTIDIGAFEYEVMVPDFVRRQLAPEVGATVKLHTIHYFEGDPSRGRMSPRLVGFASEVEREFFELFCSVDGVGAKKALRAMVKPVQEVAELIEQQDTKGVATLPGIGPATAERIIAKLRRKMPKFALLVTQKHAAASDVESDVVRDTHAILIALGHGESDARHMIDKAIASGKKFKDVDSLINAIYEKVGGGKTL